MKGQAMTPWILKVMLAAALLLPATVVQAATIYVNAANVGDPSMDGSLAHPWDTIQKGVNDLTNKVPTYGHTVLVAAGFYGNVVLTASHTGTVANVNTLLTTVSATITNVLTISTGLNNFTVDGFHIVNGGVSMATASAMTIQNCNIYSNTYGVTLNGSANCKVENCNIIFNASIGLWAKQGCALSLHNSVIAGSSYGISEAILCNVANISNCLFYANQVHWYDWIGPSYTDPASWTNRVTAAQINAAAGCGGNISANPGFTGLASWNFNELMANSPCLDAGLGGADIGAHQNPPLLSLDNATYTVDAGTGADGNDGSSGHPWATITNAAARAKAGDTVIVNAGVYTGGVTIVRGGSADKVLTYRAAGNVTIVASNSVSGIEFRRVMGAVVDGFNVDAANKAANTQCLLLTQCASNTVRNSMLHNGKTYGVYAGNSLLCQFENCSIYSNVTGVYNAYSVPSIYLRACDLRNNTSYGYQGAHQQSSYVVMENCLVRNNTNKGLYTGQGASGYLVNCTIVSNGNDGIGQQGAYSSWSLVNCIMAGNGGYGAREVFSTQMGQINLSYCDVYSNALGNLFDITNNSTVGQVLNTAYEINYLAIPAGCNTNNIVADPQFQNWAAGDLQLQQGSLCIDAGIATDLTTDYAGHRRTFGNGVDIGAFERPPPQGAVFKFR